MLSPRYPDVFGVRFGLAGWTAAQTADALGVTVRTVRAWERGKPTVSRMAWRLLALLCGGHLGELCPDWRGWTLRGGTLCGPGGLIVAPGEVLALPYQYARIAALERVIREYQQKRPHERPPMERSTTGQYQG